MIIEQCLLLQPFDSINPQQDRRWVPEGKNQWFFPWILDVKNNSYSGYWYTLEHCIEEKHSHSGISYGTMLSGEILLIIEGKKLLIEEGKSFFVSPNVLHSAELISGKNGFLNFGVIVGETYYKNERSDVKTYLEAVKSHYLNHGIDTDGIKSY